MSEFNMYYPIPDRMKNIINISSKGLGGVGVLGGLAGPGADVPLIAGVWIAMTAELADEAGLSMSSNDIKKVVLAVSSGIGAMLAGTKIASTAIAWLTAPFTLGASLAISAGANATLNYAITKAYGRAVARYFLQTKEISNTKVIAKVLISMIVVDLGL